MDSSCRNFEFILSFVLVGITCLFGLIGNGLSIQTLRRDTPRSVTNFLLLSLAVADSVFLFPAILVIMIPSYCEYFQHCSYSLMLDYLRYIEEYGWTVASMTHMCTVYVTVLVALHRYSWVCRPHDTHRWTGMRAAKIQIGVLPIIAFIFNIPRAFEYKVLLTKSHEAEIRKTLTDFGKTVYYQIIYKNICFVIIMFIIPLAVLLFVSVHLILTLRRRKTNMRSIGHRSSTQTRDDNITFVLVIIIFIFVICQTPTLLQRVVLALQTQDQEPHACGHVYFYMEQIADYMAILNSCINFVVYVLFARHFRHTLFEEVLACKRRSKNGGQTGDIALEVQVAPSSSNKSRGSRGSRGSRTTPGAGGVVGPAADGPVADGDGEMRFLSPVTPGADPSSTNERSDVPLLGRHTNNCNNNVITSIIEPDAQHEKFNCDIDTHGEESLGIERDSNVSGDKMSMKGKSGDVPLEMDKVSDGLGSYSNTAHTSGASSSPSHNV